MARLRNAVLAVALATGGVGCATFCDECDDFPIPGGPGGYAKCLALMRAALSAPRPIRRQRAHRSWPLERRLPPVQPRASGRCDCTNHTNSANPAGRQSQPGCWGTSRTTQWLACLRSLECKVAAQKDESPVG